MVQRHPGRAAGGVEQSIEQRPVGHGVGAVLHRLGLAVGAGHRAAVQVVAADYDGRAQLTRAHHFVEGQAELGAQTQADPADTRRQALEADALAGHVQPAVQVGVIRDQFLDLGVGLVDVLGVAGQRRPAERADAAAEQWADVSRDETGEVEGIAHALFLGHLADVVAVVEGRHAHLLEVEHGLYMHGHGLLGSLDHASRVGGCTILVLGPAPADRQVAVERIVGAGLVGDHVRAHATAYQFRQDFGSVAQQGDGDGLAFGAVLGDARQGVVEIGGLLVDVTAAQAKIDAGLLAFDVQRAGAGQGGGQRLGAAHAAQACGQHPATSEVAGVVLTTGFDEGFIGALDDALAADVDPATGGHLAVHGQALGIQLVEVLPARPMRHQVGVGDQHARCVAVGLEHADRLAGLHQQGLVVIQVGQALDDLVIALPVACGAADAAVHHQLLGILGHVRVEVVHQHAQRRFGQPALGGERGATRGADFGVAELGHVAGSCGNGSVVGGQSQPRNWAR